MRAMTAILSGLKDVIFGRLTLLALLNLAVAATLTGAAAWALIRYVVPMIPNGAGWLANVSTFGEFMASVAVVVLAIAISPAVSMLVGGFLFDVAAERTEKAIGAPVARKVPLLEALANAARIAAPALLLNLIVIPLYFVPGLNAIVFYGLNGFLMGREYSTVAAVRHIPYAEAVALRKRNALAVFAIGLACSIVPFFAPLVGAGAMTRFVQAARSA
ncbi:MAG: EI24 domain-containing protein [Hyphomonadaceae bacterium]|nr:EI24 domain-containing protein [Hyphomonadaceae bacterium]